MAWLARDTDEILYIYSYEPIRENFLWKTRCDNFGLESDVIVLPSNADEKLIERHISWKDNLVELK